MAHRAEYTVSKKILLISNQLGMKLVQPIQGRIFSKLVPASTVLRRGMFQVNDIVSGLFLTNLQSCCSGLDAGHVFPK
jgi:hypothetical protein